MVFLANAHTKTKHEFFKGVKIWKSMDPPCIRTKFNRHPPLLIYVFNLTYPLPWKWRFRGIWMKSTSWVNGRQDLGRIPPIPSGKEWFHFFYCTNVYRKVIVPGQLTFKLAVNNCMKAWINFTWVTWTE